MERADQLDFAKSLERFRNLTYQQIDVLMQRRNFDAPLLYGLLPAFTARRGKAIRPALCLACCAACNGQVTDAVNSAVAVELFHNAFLIKDDVEDDSEYRRRDETLKAKYGTAVALNVGDAMSVLAIRALLGNVRTIGVRSALAIFEEIQQMASRTVEGQAMELDWVRHNVWNIRDQDYYTMCQGKTAWYTAATPCRIGALIGSPEISRTRLRDLTQFGLNLGLAFQIQDDILNLTGKAEEYGKEINGDLVEGKRTLILIRTFRSATQAERRHIRRISQKVRQRKTKDDVQFLRELIDKYEAIPSCQRVSRRLATKAQRILADDCGWIPQQPAKAFLRQMADYVITRRI